MAGQGDAVPVAAFDDVAAAGSARADAVAAFDDLAAGPARERAPVARFGTPPRGDAPTAAPVAGLDALAAPGAASAGGRVRVARIGARPSRSRDGSAEAAGTTDGGAATEGAQGRRGRGRGGRGPEPRAGAAPTGTPARARTPGRDRPDAGTPGRDRADAAGAPGAGTPGTPGAADDPDADPRAVAREICLRLLTDRARTRQELAQALRRKGVPDDAAAAVLGRFDEVGLIDDAAFAQQWVRSRHAVRGLGRRALAVELRRKGVADELAGEALDTIDRVSEERRARELVDRKLRTAQAGTPQQRATLGRRLVGMLARKGYPAGVAYTVVREALAEHGAEPDELGADVPED